MLQTNGCSFNQKEVVEKVELYLNERVPTLDVKTVDEA